MNRRLAIVLVALFAVVDVALVYGAMRHVSRAPDEVDLPSAAAASATPGATPAPSSAALTGDQKKFTFVPSAAVSLSLAGDGSLIRAVRGRCDSDDDAPKVTVSPDGGKDARTVKTGLQEVLAVKAVSSRLLQVVGADGDCNIAQLESTDGGETWDDAADVTLWYPSLEDLKTVVSPETSSAPGCEVSAVSQVTPQSARVSCTNGTFYGTGDSGQTWTKLGKLVNVRTVTFPAPSIGYALAAFQGCAARAFSTRDGGRTWTPGGCITGEPAQAIAATDSTLGAVVADQLYASTDRGGSWSQP